VKLKRRKGQKKCRKVYLSLRFPYKNIRNFEEHNAPFAPKCQHLLLHKENYFLHAHFIPATPGTVHAVLRGDRRAIKDVSR
jgi:hypothetical protein